MFDSQFLQSKCFNGYLSLVKHTKCWAVTDQYIIGIATVCIKFDHNI